MNAEFLKALKQTFQDQTGEYSSKRVAAFISIFIMIVAFVANLFFGLTTAPFIFEGFEYLAIGSLGIAGFEVFADRKETTKQIVRADINVSDDTQK